MSQSTSPAPLFSPLSRLLIVGASVAVCVFAARAAADVLAPLLLALILATLLHPLVARLRKRGLPIWLALTSVLLALTVTGGVIVGVLYVSLRDFTEKLPSYQSALAAQTAALQALLASFGFDLSDLLAKGGPLEPSSLIRTGALVVSDIVASLSNTLFVLFLAIVMLADASDLPDRIRQAAGGETPITRQFAAFSRGVTESTAGLAVNNVIAAVAVAVWLSAFGVDFPLLWGVLAFLLGFVPHVGMVLAAIPPIILAFVLHGMATAVFVAAGLLVITSLLSVLVSKRVGDGVSLSTGAVFVTLVFWAWVFGALGTLLAFPLTVLVKSVLESQPETRGLAALLGKLDSKVETSENEGDASPNEARRSPAASVGSV